MHVQMGNALADTIIDGDERALGLKTRLDSAREPLRIAEQRLQQIGWQVGERLIVLARNQQTVPWEERPPIEEGDGPIVFENDVRRRLPGGNLAEDAAHGFTHSITAPCERSFAVRAALSMSCTGLPVAMAILAATPAACPMIM